MKQESTNEFIDLMKSMTADLIKQGPEACKQFLIAAGIIKEIESFDLKEVSLMPDGSHELGIDNIIYAMEEGAMQWKAEYDNCRKILQTLVELKEHKDLYGKTEHYQIVQPETWRVAKEFLSVYQHE